MNHQHLTVLAIAFSLGCSGAALGTRTINVALAHEGTDFGPPSATGTATIDTASGEVNITVSGLELLSASDEYEGWLAGGGEDPISTGKFPVDATGNGTSSINLGPLAERTYERVVLTVEPVPDPSPGPDSRHSIGGDIPPE